MKKFQRHFSAGVFRQVQTDLQRLIQAVRDPALELDFQIRPDDAFNVYYRGNSLAHVKTCGRGYVAKIAKAFIAASDGVPEKLFRPWKPELRNGYYQIALVRAELNRFFARDMLNKLRTKIKDRGYSDEALIEQTILAANLRSSQLTILDRQVQLPGVRRKLDALGLIRKETSLRLCAIEIKRHNDGRNDPSSNQNVLNQTARYVQICTDRMAELLVSYQENVKQKSSLGLPPAFEPVWDCIDRNTVDGVVVLVGAGPEAEIVSKLKKARDGDPKFSRLTILPLSHTLDFSRVL